MLHTSSDKPPRNQPRPGRARRFPPPARWWTWAATGCTSSARGRAARAAAAGANLAGPAAKAKQAALSTNGRLVVAEASGHNVFVDQPDLVVQSIAEVLAAARR